MKCEHKVELLEEVLEEFQKLDKCNCFVVRKLVEEGEWAEHQGGWAEQGRGTGDGGEDSKAWIEVEKGEGRRRKQND